jgi:hypothetical protein
MHRHVALGPEWFFVAERKTISLAGASRVTRGSKDPVKPSKNR